MWCHYMNLKRDTQLIKEHITQLTMYSLCGSHVTPFPSLFMKMEADMEDRHNMVNPFSPVQSYPTRPNPLA